MNGKIAGNLILMTVVCMVIFWVVMALHPVQAATLKCGSSWDICTQRGRGPGTPKVNTGYPYGQNKLPYPEPKANGRR
jgi:hypothetical protein